MRMQKIAGLASLVLLLGVPAQAADGNRLTYLDEFCEPYYVHREFPKLITPQWVGEEDVEAVATLGIDDMRDAAKYEAYLRPLLDRLKKIDGRAPVSIMTNVVDPAHPQLQVWLKEGLSIETHTADHPCPCLQSGDFGKAKSTYDRCVDQVSSIPNNRPVAFRFPCMDSLNTPSPRAFAEIFNRTTPGGNFLRISTSVCVLLTPEDSELPRELVAAEDGNSRFARYVPFPSFVNKVENYPYPFVIGRLCWEFPCAVPDDWQGHNLQGPRNPQTVDDIKACLDATVAKQGSFNLIFHPHGWIGSEQVASIVDHAEKTHGRKVKFLNFAECDRRITENLLAGEPLRAADGGDNGVRLLDLNADGYMDVVIGNEKVRLTRLWQPAERRWIDSETPATIVRAGSKPDERDGGVRFGILRKDGAASMFVLNEYKREVWHFDNGRWQMDEAMTRGLELGREPLLAAREGRDQGVRLRDLDRDGRCELIVGNPKQNAVLHWNDQGGAWQRLRYGLPENTMVVDATGRDAGLRFVDIDEDAFDDVVFSNENFYSLHLFDSTEHGWSRTVRTGTRGDGGALPMIARAGTNNGAWFARRHMWVQNEDTARLPDGVDRRSFDELLGEIPPPRSPEAGVKSMIVPPEFEIEVAAAEPHVMDPVAFDWSPDGRLWVVEMADYPLGIDGRGKGGGRARFLEDEDGDGRYDRSTLFLDNLNFPTGIMAWKSGAIVIAAPQIFYAEDTNGDGKADRREVLFEGFTEGNQQHRVNGLRWGLDNWVYLANGDSGGKIRSPKSDQSIDVRGRDLRVRPEEGLIDAQMGQSQFGRERDDWGNWFGNNNSNPMWHFVLDDRYVRRNPHLAAPDSKVHVMHAGPVFPASRTLARFNDLHTANRFTSACSAIIYRDELLGEEFAGNGFVCEPVHNLVHREIVSPQGVTFTGRRADGQQQSEFVASRDNWFRPTMVRTGPDGALWIADMYRFVIEHPEWIPDDWESRLDLRAGHDKGRIYRVFRKDAPPRPFPRLDKMNTAELVAALDTPNGVQRDMVQHLLVSSQDKTAIPELERIARAGERPAARLHALCSLDGLNGLTPELLAVALADGYPGVRRHAIRLAEPLLNEAPKLGPALLELLDDPDAQVQLQLCYSLGEWNDPKAADALGTLALKHQKDAFLSAAVGSSLNERNIGAALAIVLKSEQRSGELLQRMVAMATAFGDRRSLGDTIWLISESKDGKFANWQFTALSGIFDQMERRNEKVADLVDPSAVERLGVIWEEARALAIDETAPVEARLAALTLVGRESEKRENDTKLLGKLLSPQNPDELQMGAVAALARLRTRDAAVALLANWKSHTPRLRARVLDTLLTTKGWADELLAAIGRGDVRPEEVDAARRQNLLNHADEKLRERAKELFAASSAPDRQQVIEEYRDVAAIVGDRARGQAVFEKKCAVCHRLGDVGNAVGSDLATLTDRAPSSLLVAILDPNRAVEDKFVSYTALTTDGRQFSGMLLNETGNSITLVGQDNKQETILRTQLDALQSTGKSLMPEGLEKDLSRQDLADVIAYLGDSGPPPKRFAGNDPGVVRVGDDGTFVLPASKCKIYGDTIIFEPTYTNLGYWSSPNDHAVWLLEIPRERRWRVVLDYACDNSNAGNQFALQVAGQELLGKVPGTGSWDDYREWNIGVVTIPAGTHSLIFRPVGNLRGALIDLRTIKLVPL